MAKKRLAALNLIELQLTVQAHCQGLKAVVQLLDDGSTAAAIARLDGLVVALEAIVKSQCAGSYIACPHCGSKQDVVAWAENGLCSKCGGDLNTADEEE